ncbi:MAG: hypothetical protein ACRBFS_15815 [Aureispira sp.]
MDTPNNEHRKEEFKKGAGGFLKAIFYTVAFLVILFIIGLLGIHYGLTHAGGRIGGP